MTPYGPAWYEELSLLIDALPPRIAEAARRLPDGHGELLEIVLDLGREPEARFDHGEQILDTLQVTPEDLDYVTSRVGAFGDDNRAGIERTLHRISAIRNRSGHVVGLTCRVGRAVTGTIDILKDIVVGGRSILLLGAPGIGKTTMLRECARVLSEECRKRVVIVDTSNEIAGDGDIPHPGIGRARRMQVATPAMQHAVMIEAVENHMPEVIVIDEIGTELEAVAARTIAERGVQLVGTAHGRSLDNLMVNPTLNDLLGGIQTVTLSDEEARRRGTQKSVLERKAPPTFDVLVELRERDRVIVHMPLDEVVDAALRGQVKPAEQRSRDAGGRVVTTVEAAAHMAPVFDLPSFGGGAGRWDGSRDRRGRSSARWEPERPRRSLRSAPAPDLGSAAPALAYEGREREMLGGRPLSPTQPLNVFPYGVSRTYLEQAVRELHLPVRIQHHVDDADTVLTLKNYYRRKDSPVRAAESTGIPIQVLRSNTVAQIKGALARVYGVDPPDPTETALQEALEGIARVQQTRQQVELAPQNAYVRRLQHQLVEQHELVAHSHGVEPNRRLRILSPGEEEEE
ncbi:MAG TPA: R3H domain-containing nucleic acid-binding protein [Candidatus Dormibacteraeota bacterium]|nr:R3H domain-containing nucleic acid-binding protein [Candidatus Dormibacteraeota bacterium]